MSIDLTRLVVALYYEHKARTGHDCTLGRGLNESYLQQIGCDVCINLEPLMKQAEAESYPEPPSDESTERPKP